jgi:hypothetical protein
VLSHWHVGLLSPPAVFVTNVARPTIPPSPINSHHAQSPPILSTSPNSRINLIAVGDDTCIDVHAHDDPIVVEGHCEDDGGSVRILLG